MYPFGATLASYVTSAGREVLFVSKLAKTDGSKAIRGGVPLVFPQFGQPNKDMPSHGFLRCNYWTTGTSYDNDNEAGCEFTLALKDVTKGRGEGIWADGTADCALSYMVKIKASSLTTTLHIKNTGEKSFDYQTLLHTYYRINGSKAMDKDSCNVLGLEGYNVDDKITGEQSVQDGTSIIIDREVDRIYSPPEGKSKLEVKICSGQDGSELSLEASATDGKKDIPVSAVVWNPYIEKAQRLGDFDNEEYHDMLCVEPGLLNGLDALAPGEEVSFEQNVTCM